MVRIRSQFRRVSAIFISAIALITTVMCASPAFAQQGVHCNPDIRAGNSACSEDELCLRLGGDCGILNAICIDQGPGRATAIGSPLCPGVCRNSRGLCESNATFCNVDNDCVAHLELCTLGQCVYQAGTCLANADCNPGESCENGHCRAAPKPPTPPHGCTSSAQCSRDQQCVYGGCRPLKCLAASQCGPGQLCRAGRCVGALAPQCTTSAQCASDSVCQNHKCLQF